VAVHHRRRGHPREYTGQRQSSTIGTLHLPGPALTSADTSWACAQLIDAAGGHGWLTMTDVAARPGEDAQANGCSPMLSLPTLSKLSLGLLLLRPRDFARLDACKLARHLYSGVGVAGCVRLDRIVFQTWPCSFKALCTSHSDTCTPCSADKRVLN